MECQCAFIPGRYLWETGFSGRDLANFKVFVNYIPVADITQLNNVLFKSLKKDAIEIDGIFYTPPNFLRMSMYLELSRPAGDVSRWEKILKRLILLNKNYPIKGKNCEHTKIQRTYEGNKKSGKI